MTRSRLSVALLLAALFAPWLAAALPLCDIAEHCEMEAHGMEASGCHGATLGAGECCLDETQTPAPADRSATVPSTDAERAESVPALRADVARRHAEVTSEGLSPPRYTLFRALLI